MRKTIFFALLLGCAGLTGVGFAQTANQYIDAGNQSYAAKDYAKAAQYYQAAVQMDPNSAAAYQGLGNSQYGQGQDSQALDSYQKALALNPNNTALSSFVDQLKAKVGAAPASSSVALPTAAQNTAGGSSSGSANKFELDVNAGLGLDGGQFGFGGGLGGFIPLDKSFAIGAMAGFYTFSVGASTTASGYGVTAGVSESETLNFIEGMAAAKYRFDGTGMKPYILAGLGIADLMDSYTETASSGGSSASASSSASSVDPMFAIGAGLEFPAGKDMNVFVQVKESIVLIPSTTETVNEGGYNVTVSGGGGTASYTVAEGGLDFDL